MGLLFWACRFVREFRAVQGGEGEAGVRDSLRRRLKDLDRRLTVAKLAESPKSPC